MLIKEEEEDYMLALAYMLASARAFMQEQDYTINLFLFLSFLLYIKVKYFYKKSI
jgi:hypothetical protein